MRTPARLLALATLLVAAACGSYNPLRWVGIIGPEPAHAPTPLAQFNATVTPRAVWTASVGKATGLQLRPVATAGRVYAAAADGTVTAVEEDSGKQALRYDTRKRIGGGLAAGGGRIFAGTLKGEVVAFDDAGKLAWATSVSGEVIAPPEISRNTVVARTSDGRIFGLAAADGKRLWVYQRATPPLLLRSAAGVLAIGGDVLAGYPNGKLIALDLDDGKLTWEVTVALARGTTELERIADVAGLPVIDGGNVCAVSFQGKVACFEIQTRNLLWSKDFSSSKALAADAKNLYLVDDAGAVVALDKKTGASVWKQDKLQYRRVSAPVVVDGRIVVGDGYGYLHVLSPDNGEIVGRLALDGTEVMSLVPSGGALLVQTTGGALASVRF